MATFLRALLLFTGILLVLGAPVIVVAWRKGRHLMARRFLIAAGSVGILCAIISTTSEKLVSQCEAAGNTSCLDSGARGFQVLAVSIFAVGAIGKLVEVIRE